MAGRMAEPGERCPITFRVGHLLDYRDTAEIARILHELRAYGFVSAEELAARPFTVPESERRLPRWAGTGGR